jgi:hypothetical protein
MHLSDTRKFISCRGNEFTEIVEISAMSCCHVRRGVTRKLGSGLNTVHLNDFALKTNVDKVLDWAREWMAGTAWAY